MLVVGLSFLLIFPRIFSQTVTRIWTKGATVLMQCLLGLDFEVRGTPPKGPCIIVSKHQSAWDTFFFYLLLKDPNYVLKKELAMIPIWGWCALKCGAISVDRAGGMASLKKLVRDVQDRMSARRQVVIFPEGTRTPPGVCLQYQPGVAAIYGSTTSAVVPVALNSGLFWGRRSFGKCSGVITVHFLDPMPQGLKRREFMAELEIQIESATTTLISEAKSRFPHLAHNTNS
jgi:1-acyl-sn-glycerol-3-phosphate acyltransferase